MESGREGKLFFVVSTSAGRIAPADQMTIKQVMGSIQIPDANGVPQKPGMNMYGLIVNKCTFLEEPAFINGGKERIQAYFSQQSVAVPYTTSFIVFLPEHKELVNEANGMSQFE